MDEIDNESIDSDDTGGGDETDDTADYIAGSELDGAAIEALFAACREQDKGALRDGLRAAARNKDRPPIADDAGNTLLHICALHGWAGESIYVSPMECQ